MSLSVRFSSYSHHTGSGVAMVGVPSAILPAASPAVRVSALRAGSAAGPGLPVALHAEPGNSTNKNSNLKENFLGRTQEEGVLPVRPMPRRSAMRRQELAVAAAAVAGSLYYCWCSPSNGGDSRAPPAATRGASSCSAAAARADGRGHLREFGR